MERSKDIFKHLAEEIERSGTMEERAQMSVFLGSLALRYLEEHDGINE